MVICGFVIPVAARKFGPITLRIQIQHLRFEHKDHSNVYWL